MKRNKIVLFITVLAILLTGSITEVEAQKKVVKSHTFNEARNMRFGEIIVNKATGFELYNTAGLGECPADIWNSLDPNKLAVQFDALNVQLNGPQYYLADTVTLWLRETADFGGIKARWDAALDPTVVGTSQQPAEPYKVFFPKWKQRMVFAKGNPVYELIDPEGNNYILGARKENVPMESLATLNLQMKKLPKDWQFRTRILTEDLLMDLSPVQTIYAVRDEFNQYYAKPSIKPATFEDIQLLFVQTSENLVVDTKANTIRLVNVNPQTLYFSDRPERIAGHILMNDYLEYWDPKAGKDNFNEDPPNASLSVYQSGQSENTVVVVEISNPVVDGSDLIYNYNIINGSMPAIGGAASLFIDVIANRGIGLGHRGPGI